MERHTVTLSDDVFEILSKAFRPQSTTPTPQDLTFGDDGSGTPTLFICYKHITANGWGVKKVVKDIVGSSLQYFRIIDENGKRQRGHGWIERGKIVQWG